MRVVLQLKEKEVDLPLTLSISLASGNCHCRSHWHLLAVMLISFRNTSEHTQKQCIVGCLGIPQFS